MYQLVTHQGRLRVRQAPIPMAPVRLVSFVMREGIQVMHPVDVPPVLRENILIHILVAAAAVVLALFLARGGDHAILAALVHILALAQIPVQPPSPVTEPTMHRRPRVKWLVLWATSRRQGQPLALPVLLATMHPILKLSHARRCLPVATAQGTSHPARRRSPLAPRGATRLAWQLFADYAVLVDTAAPLVQPTRAIVSAVPLGRTPPMKEPSPALMFCQDIMQMQASRPLQRSFARLATSP